MQKIWKISVIGLAAAAGWIGTVSAQVNSDRPPRTPVPNQGAACPPDVKGIPPTVGGPSAPNLSDQLSDSKGVICPPAGVDPQVEVPPPAGGALKVIPPPGSPGGDPTVQPK